MRHLILTILIAIPLLLGARTEDDENPRCRVAFNATLTSSDTYSLEASGHYMLCRYVGIGGALGIWANYYDDGWASGKDWNIDDDDNRPSNLYLRPSVVLESPAIRYRASSWSLFAEPGIMLNIPYQRVCIESTPDWPVIEYDYISTNKGQWLAYEVRAGISLGIGPCGLSAGYTISNLDIYSQYRHLTYKGTPFTDFYPRKPLMQGAYISLAYTF